MEIRQLSIGKDTIKDQVGTVSLNCPMCTPTRRPLAAASSSPSHPRGSDRDSRTMNQLQIIHEKGRNSKNRCTFS